ncbi:MULTISPECIES: STAS domain-containing protein [Streptomyces]|uniref:STAS domain-containing protein n=1 Tax=Streptomyces TaxID=1883 RepID=UPI0007C726F9|nr:MULTISPECIES: STAS domain-containing protein [Streptomyces]MCM1944086.1 STAS domain-containing protein [Streptomyces sp. G2]
MSSARPGGHPHVDTSQPFVMSLPAGPTREEVARLCAELAAAPPGEVRCRVDPHADGLAAVDALARIALAARRRGHRLHFDGAGPGLTALLRLTGLDEVL